MLKKIKTFIVVAVASLTFGAPVLVPALAGGAYALNNVQSNLCTGVTDATGSNDTTCGIGESTDTAGSIKTLAAKVVNIFSIIVGVVAVIMIIVGGFKYITSGGESSNVSGAKNTLIYAIIGLIIVALAQFIVHYVLATTSQAGLS